MLQISQKTFIFINTPFIEITLKIICCHTAALGLKGQKKNTGMVFRLVKEKKKKQASFN